jgi:hypothetical protein
MVGFGALASLRLFFGLVTALLASAAEPRIDVDTAAALKTFELGELLTEKQVERIVRWHRLKHMDAPISSLDLSMRVALFRYEIGHPMASSDAIWLVRFFDRKLPLGNYFPQATQLSNQVPGTLEFRPLPNDRPIGLPVARSADWEAVKIVRVIEQAGSAIFQRANGAYYFVQYGRGIVFTNYCMGAVMWANIENGEWKILQRSSGNQHAKVRAVRLAVKPP